MQVGLGCLADVAEGQVSDGIAVVVQRVEHQKAFPLQNLPRQQFPARKAWEVRPGPGRRLPAGPQHHVLPIAAGVVPLLLFEAVVVPVVDAQPDPFAAEDLPVRVHRVHQLRQAARRQHLLRHSLLPVVEALQEARLVEVAIPDGAGHRLVRAAAGLREHHLRRKQDPLRLLAPVNQGDEPVHRVVVQLPVVPRHRAEPGDRELRTVQVVKAGYQETVRAEDPALREGLQQPQRHLVVGAHEGVRQLLLLPQPAFGELPAVRRAPAAGDHLHVLLPQPVQAAGVQKAVQPQLPLRAAVAEHARQIHHAPDAVLTNQVLRHVVLRLPVVDPDRHAALHRAVDRHRRNSCLPNHPLDEGPGALQHDLVPLHQHPVELRQVRQPVDRVLAQVRFRPLVLAEAVENPQVHVLMLCHVVLQTAQRALHQLVVPVASEKRNAVSLHFSFVLSIIKCFPFSQYRMIYYILYIQKESRGCERGP